MRKTKRVVIEADNRDKGKIFVLTEMPASQAEKWAVRALLALTHAGAEIPEDIEGSGMAGIAMMGLHALTSLRFADAEPLLDEMFDCVRFCPDGSHPEIVRPLIEDDIEEVGTRLRLRKDVLELHVDFSLPGVQSKPPSETPPQSPAGSRITRTSRAR